jgi:hypothetical protein
VNGKIIDRGWNFPIMFTRTVMHTLEAGQSIPDFIFTRHHKPGGGEWGAGKSFIDHHYLLTRLQISREK